MTGDVVDELLGAVERGDWGAVKAIVHPYIRWTHASGELLRGRVRLLTYLAEAPVSVRPECHELRDGQIYRWSEPAPAKPQPVERRSVVPQDRE